MIVGLIKPREGKIFLDDEEITHFLFIKEPEEVSDIWHRKLQYSETCRLKTISGQFLKCRGFQKRNRKRRLETLLD